MVSRVLYLLLLFSFNVIIKQSVCLSVCSIQLVELKKIKYLKKTGDPVWLVLNSRSRKQRLHGAHLSDMKR